MSRCRSPLRAGATVSTVESVLVASRSILADLRPDDMPTLRSLASDPPGFEREGSRVFISDAAAYLRDMRLDARGTAALDAGLALLPGRQPPTYREVLHSGGTAALADLLAAWGRRDSVVVWDSEDQARPLPEC